MVEGRFKITLLFLLLVVGGLFSFPLREEVLDAVGIIYSIDLKRGELHQGTAFTVDPEGLIVTSLHVVLPSYKNPENPVVVIFNRSSYTGKVLCADDLSDIAIIKVRGKNLPYLRIGSIRRLEEGSEIYALSFPGTGRPMFSFGRVEKIYRGGRVKFIITSAPLSFGSSGGPLLNRRGEVVGIATFILVRGKETRGILVSSDNIKSLLSTCGGESPYFSY